MNRWNHKTVDDFIRGRVALDKVLKLLDEQPTLVRSVAKGEWRRSNRQRHKPHQGAKECARRRRQMGLTP